MKKYINFSLYTPEVKDEEVPSSALFLRSEDGVDWYAAQLEFEANTVKIMFDASGKICCAEVEAAGMWPVDCSVIEIDPDKLPPDFAGSGFIANQWLFKDGEIKPVPVDYSARAVSQRHNLISSANAKINLWQTKLLAGRELTNEQKAALDAWLDYMDKLEALDFSGVKDEAGYKAIEWPDVPQ